MHDKAFDKGLITITTEYKVKLSARLKENQNPAIVEFFRGTNGKQIELPSKFLPSKDFLDYHNQYIFIY